MLEVPILDPATAGKQAEQLFAQQDTSATVTVLADMIEAAAASITPYHISGIINEVADDLNVPAADLVLRLADTIRIRNAAMIANPFIPWIRDNTDPDLAEIREFLITRLTTTTAPGSPSRAWLRAVVEGSAVAAGNPTLIYGFNQAWDRYQGVITRSGNASTITYRDEFRVHYQWPDGHREGSDTQVPMTRREAEGTAFRHNNQGRQSSATPQSRTTIAGCWVDLPGVDNDPEARRPIPDGPMGGRIRRTVHVRPLLDGPMVDGER
jgi:hypothetical protein